MNSAKFGISNPHRKMRILSRKGLFVIIRKNYINKNKDMQTLFSPLKNEIFNNMNLIFIGETL